MKREILTWIKDLRPPINSEPLLSSLPADRRFPWGLPKTFRMPRKRDPLSAACASSARPVREESHRNSSPRWWWWSSPAKHHSDRSLSSPTRERSYPCGGARPVHDRDSLRSPCQKTSWIFCMNWEIRRTPRCRYLSWRHPPWCTSWMWYRAHTSCSCTLPRVRASETCCNVCPCLGTSPFACFSRNWPDWESSLADRPWARSWSRVPRSPRLAPGRRNSFYFPLNDFFSCLAIRNVYRSIKVFMDFLL